MPRKKVNRPSFVKSSKTPQRKKTGCGGASGSNKNPSVSCVNLSSSDVGTDENACDRDSMDTATELPPSTSGALTGSQRSAKGILAYKKITKYSGVWNHFLVQTLDNKETGKVQCIHCPKDGKTGLLTPGGSTGTMNTHMRGHDIVPKGSSQRTLDNLVKKVTPISAREKKEIEDSLVEMVASDGCPLSIVEKPGFKRYTAKLLGLSQKEFTLPSRRTLGRRLKDKAIEGVEKVKTLLEAVTNLGAITCDLRSDRRHRTYITVTFHVVDANFVLQKIVLATRRIRFRRTGEIIAKEVREILESFGVLDKVAEAVTDNGGDVKKAMRLLNKNRISCFAHLLHLALVNGLGLWVKSPMADPVAPAAEANVDPSCAEVNPGASSAEPDQIGEQESEWRDLNLDEEAEEEDDAEDIDIFWKKTYLKVSTQEAIQSTLAKVRKLTNMFSHSNLASDILGEKCNEKNLVSDIKTRWNSTQAMLQRILELKEAVTATLNDSRVATAKSVEKAHLTPADWVNIEELHKFLSPFADITAELSGSHYVTLPKTYIAMQFIRENCIVKTEDSKVTRLLKTAFQEKFEFYFNNEENVNTQLLMAATYLDPTTRHMVDMDSVTVDEIEETIHQLWQDHFSAGKRRDVVVAAESSGSDNDTPGPSSSRSMLASFINAKKRKISSAATPDNSDYNKLNVEMATYRHLTIDCEDGLRWWKSQTAMPLLSKVVSFLMCVPATSVPSEVSFSIAGNFVRKERARISAKTVEDCTFLKNNWDIIRLDLI